MKFRFEILNYCELPIKVYQKREVILWKDIKKGFIFKTEHEVYGYNEFEFVKWNTGDNISIKYSNDIYNITTYVFKDGGIGRIIGRISNDFKYKVGQLIKDNNRDFEIKDIEVRRISQKPDKKGRVYTKNEKWYKYTCNVCGWNEGWLPENNINKGTGCGCCANKSTVLGINSIWDTDRWMCDLGVSEEDAKKYTRASGKRINVICPYCKNKKNAVISDINSNKSIGCICGDGFSYPEKFMYNVLTQLGVEFETQYSPKYLILNDSKKYSDFYIPSLKLVIEVDGGMGHEGGVMHSMSNKTLEECVSIDKWKDEQHLKNGVKTIRINCFKSEMEYIRSNILNSELVKCLDFICVDWVGSDLYAFNSNKVKEVCDCWNTRKHDETTTDIGLKFGISKKSILRYLKLGDELGMCDYNPTDVRMQTALKISKSKIYPVSILKDGVVLGIFRTATDLERQSETIFGVKLSHSSIYATIYGKQKTHKGYTFKKISTEEYEVYINIQ